MIRTIIYVILFMWADTVNAQDFQQEIKYDIEARYDDNTHQVDGKLNINYSNNSPNTLDTLYFHLWANAFSSKTNSYTDQTIKLGQLEYYFAKRDKLGGYDQISIGINGKSYELKYNDSKQIAYITLDKSLKSGESVSISVDYNLTLPYLFDRFGWSSKGVQLVHWYPSIAVYDNEGWHPMEYLAMGELYSTVADYRVRLELPFEKTVSSGAIDGSTYSKNIVDFAIIANDKLTLSKEIILGIEISMLHKTESSLTEANEVLKKVLPWLEKHIGPYPQKTMAIVEKGKSGGMEYSGVVTLGAEDFATMEYYLIHELIHQWFYGSIVTDQRNHAWLDEGFTTYFQQRYYEETYGTDHYTEQSPKLHGTKDGVPILQKLAITQAYRAYDQPLCTHIDNVSSINYGLNSYAVPAMWISHLQNYLGIEIFDECITSFYKNWNSKHPSPSDFQDTFEKVSGKSLDWFFKEMPTGSWATDYKIKKSHDGYISITNNSQLAAPYEIKTIYKDGSEQNQWQEGHTSKKEVVLNNQLKVSSITLGPVKGLMDRNLSDNRLGGRSLKIVPGLGFDDNRYKEIYAMPLLNYNTSDGVKLGAALYNSSFSPKRWKYLVAPQYGFKSKKLVGQAWTSYDHYLDHPNYRKLFFKLGVKSYSDQYATSFGQSLRFIKIDPTVSLHFRHSPDSHTYSKLTFKYIYLQNEDFSIDDIDLYTKSNIFQLRYEAFNFYELSPSDISINLEYQPYEGFQADSQKYLKLTTSYKKSWFYNPTKKLSFRLFGAYHLVNSRRSSSSYDKRITRGATALIQQGFNDYTYEESWYNRNNQNQGLWGKQISNYGGGFKVPLGSAYSIGQSNDLALAFNFEIDLPIKLPKFIPLGLFVDVGYYTTKDTETENLSGNTLFSGGLALNYGEGLFSIYLPLYNNDPINSIFESEGTNLLGKISFRMDINRFNPWEILEDYNF